MEFYDLIGNKRKTNKDKNGITEIQLTPAPLLIKADNLDLLTQALSSSEAIPNLKTSRRTFFEQVPIKQ